MKKLFCAMSLLLVMNAYADIEFTSAEESKASTEEVLQNRYCFKEVELQGCGDPGEDPRHFRSCLKNIKPKLTDSCQKMMTELYGK